MQVVVLPDVVQKPGKCKLFNNTVVRFEPGDQHWYLMNGQERGWARRAYRRYKSPDEVLDDFDVRLGLLSKDEHSSFIQVIANA